MKIVSIVLRNIAFVLIAYYCSYAASAVDDNYRNTENSGDEVDRINYLNTKEPISSEWIAESMSLISSLQKQVTTSSSNSDIIIDIYSLGSEILSFLHDLQSFETIPNGHEPKKTNEKDKKLANRSNLRSLESSKDSLKKDNWYHHGHRRSDTTSFVKRMNVLRRRKRQWKEWKKAANVTDRDIESVMGTLETQNCSICDRKLSEINMVPLSWNFTSKFETLLQEVNVTPDMIQMMNESTSRLFNEIKEYNRNVNVLFGNEPSQSTIFTKLRDDNGNDLLLRVIPTLFEYNKKSLDSVTYQLLSTDSMQYRQSSDQGFFFRQLYLYTVLSATLLVTSPLWGFLFFFLSFLRPECNSYDIYGTNPAGCDGVWGFIFITLIVGVYVFIFFLALSSPIFLIANALDFITAILTGIPYQPGVFPSNDNKNNNSYLELLQLKESLSDVKCNLEALQCNIKNSYIATQNRGVANNIAP